jgi:hypothetical protein
MLLPSLLHLSVWIKEDNGKGDKSDGNCDKEGDRDGSKSNGNSNKEGKGEGKGGKMDGDGNKEGVLEASMTGTYIEYPYLVGLHGYRALSM